MRSTDHTLMEHLKITSREIARRMEYLGISENDVKLLESMRQDIADHMEDIVDQFYKNIIVFDEMDRIIGDSQTLSRLKNHQRRYILSLFDGQYDDEYVHSRLRVGVVHKRIGLNPKFYVAAIHTLSTLLRDFVTKQNESECINCAEKQAAVQKILMFDLSLTVDTYINSLMTETRRAREEIETYAASLEETVAVRTRLLKEQARHDGLTGLLNQHTFYKELKRELSRANRLNLSTALLYFDLDGFKKLNDSRGHKAGDKVLAAVAQAIKKTTRENEVSARYGGDEFCIILSPGNLEDGKTVSRRLCDEVKKVTKGTGISISIGIAVSTPEKSMDSNALVKAADKAMYQAKKETGFTIKFSEPA